MCLLLLLLRSVLVYLASFDQGWQGVSQQNLWGQLQQASSQAGSVVITQPTASKWTQNTDANQAVTHWTSPYLHLPTPDKRNATPGNASSPTTLPKTAAK